ncbi:RagB/SusD family nutrient uptake outer membrane protein [Sphingobacterium suaedae]|uniref:RagB/SusD family nutrient uptake outer membrane protein n=1 Tax=Sphingobacterium suaedae TaxID=1686402 RepID=A0ABW5KHP0_9SPHI
MKTYINDLLKRLPLLSVIFLFLGCNDDFMDRVPTTSISSESFFNSVSDLKTYTDGFYSYLSSPILDGGSDNIAHHNSGSTIDQMMRGGITPQNAAVWSWTQLRNINFFLENYNRVTGNKADIDHYAGIARFFRARFYIEKVRTYGDVPWYSHSLKTLDTELLHKKQDPRTLIVDSIFADLDFAVEHIQPKGHKSTITKWAALAQMAQFALYEGTFRKYHTYLGLDQTAASFLEKAANAADEIMTKGEFSISKTGGVDRAYRELFISENLQANPETILYLDYDKSLNVRRNAHTVLDYEWALSQSLMETYLMKDGTRFTEQHNYKTKDIHSIFENRDPRLSQTFMVPGFQSVNAESPHRLKPTLGGYNQIKFYPEVVDMISWEAAYTDAFVFRYAEILLIYAEAKAELGKLTSQSDLDRSVNLLRERVNMPKMLLSQVQSDIDPVLKSYFRNVSGEQAGVILEIRRERRIELACEGFRQTDLFRWESGALLEDQQQGMYVKGLGAMDVTGDGKVDIAILASSAETGPISSLPEDVKKGLTLYYLKDDNGNNTSFYLENGTNGHIMFTVARDNKKDFVAPKHYYYPIANSEMVLNGSNLVQSYGW